MTDKFTDYFSFIISLPFFSLRPSDNMSPGRPVEKAPVQGGFLVVRPDEAAAAGLWAIVKRGDFRKGGGWEGSGIGNFWGGMTIQGLLPFYATKVAAPSWSEEVDRCVFNQMVDAAGDPTSKSKQLATMRVPNCRHTPFADTLNVHFTLCQKPWSCQRGHRQSLCMDFHKEWMKRRSALEARLIAAIATGTTTGGALPQPAPACKRGLSGEGAYQPLDIPVEALLKSRV